MSEKEQPNLFKNQRKSVGEAYEEITWRRAEGFPDPNEPFQIIPELEFDAPQYYEEGVTEERPYGYVDPWFKRPHPELWPKNLEIVQVNDQQEKNSKKKKLSEFHKKESENVVKKPEIPKFRKTSNNDKVKNLGEKENISLNTSSNLSLTDKSKVPNKVFKGSANVSFNASQIGKAKRGISLDTYSFYSTHQNILDNSSLNSKVPPRKTASSVRYVPRIHNEKVMKKWSSLHNGINWYSLSPNSREKANAEMTEMIKSDFN